MAKEVTQERMESALNFLAETDYEYAELDGAFKNAEKREDLEKDIAFVTSTGSNVREREANAAQKIGYQNAKDDTVRAYIAFKKIKAKRETAGILIDVWRTLESSRRNGRV
jgi:hypothetical protein